MSSDMFKVYPSGEARRAAMRAACGYDDDDEPEPAPEPKRRPWLRDYRWYDTGLGGCCGACEEAGRVLPGHSACSAPIRISRIDITSSEFDGQTWRLLAFCLPSEAEERGWQEVAS